MALSSDGMLAPFKQGRQAIVSQAAAKYVRVLHDAAQMFVRVVPCQVHRLAFIKFVGTQYRTHATRFVKEAPPITAE